jgi:DNA polymerase-4
MIIKHSKKREAHKKNRKIIHIDMDCFFAAIEIRENPRLKGKPVAVGGQPGSRGVVATCSYEARQYGIHSAMPVAKAIKLCPHLICLPVRMSLYKQVSQDIQQIFQEYTDWIEPLSLDEAFLDVSESTHCNGSATLIAEDIRQRIYDSQYLTASAGVAENKFLAKIASDWNKPNGLTLVTPESVDEFIRNVPVSRIPGVGKVTVEKMALHNIKHCLDLQTYTEQELSAMFGKFGHRLFTLCRGIDDRPVETERVRKSLSVEDTFPVDLPSVDACLTKIPELFSELLKRLARAKQSQSLQTKTLFIKMRFFDFSTTTLQMSGNHIAIESYIHLCKKVWARGEKPVRLLGLGIQFHPPEQPEQLHLL